MSDNLKKLYKKINALKDLKAAIKEVKKAMFAEQKAESNNVKGDFLSKRSESVLNLFGREYQKKLDDDLDSNKEEAYDDSLNADTNRDYIIHTADEDDDDDSDLAEKEDFESIENDDARRDYIIHIADDDLREDKPEDYENHSRLKYLGRKKMIGNVLTHLIGTGNEDDHKYQMEVHLDRHNKNLPSIIVSVISPSGEILESSPVFYDSIKNAVQAIVDHNLKKVWGGDEK